MFQELYFSVAISQTYTAHVYQPIGFGFFTILHPSNYSTKIDIIEKKFKVWFTVPQPSK